MAATPRFNAVCACGWSASFADRAEAAEAFEAHDRWHREQEPGAGD